MKRKPFAVLASLFLVLAIIVSCDSEPYSKYPSVDCIVHFVAGEDWQQLDSPTVHVKGSGGVELPPLKDTPTHTFLGWSLTKGDREQIVGKDGRFYPESNGDIYLYPIFAQNKVTITYHINYDDTEDIIYDVVEMNYGEEFSLPKLNDYHDSELVTVEFAGWTEEKKAKVDDLKNGKIDTPLEDTHYYAQWKKPVTLTWLGREYSEEIKVRAFDKIKFPEKTPQDKIGEYRFTGIWIDSNSKEEITADSTMVVYEDHTFEAKYGDKVNITYMNNGKEYTNENIPYNYIGFTYDLPKPTEEEIPFFGGWFTDEDIAVDGELVKGDIILYAKTGIEISLVAKNVNDGKTISNGSAVVVANTAKAININYPYINDYSPSSKLYVDEECNIPLTDIDGNFVKEKTKYTENGVWNYEIKENESITIYTKWEEADLVGGDIMLKVNTHDNRTYSFYDKDYKKLIEKIDDNIPSYSYGDDVENISAVPYYYTVSGDIVTDSHDINDKDYIIVYNAFNGNRYTEIDKYYSEKISGLDEKIDNIGTPQFNGFDMSNIFAEDKVERTIGYYINEARSNTDGITDWFVPALKEITEISKYIDKNKFVSYLGIESLTISSHIIWTTSYLGTETSYVYGAAIRGHSDNKYNISPYNIELGSKKYIFLMRMI